MAGLHFGQFRAEVVRPSLESIKLWSPAAEILVAGTAVQESKLTYLRQFGNGPALGLYQMEPATLADIITNFLTFRSDLFKLVGALKIDAVSAEDNLKINLAYATAMCRVHYLRDPTPMPSEHDLMGLGTAWKRHYNTPAGKGTADEWVRNLQAVL